MTDVAILQSGYLPWKGYFDIIRAVDIFVFYDDVQYTKNDWRNRNLIKTSSGLQWLTVPVGKNINRLICDVEINENRWQNKHWKTIRQAYSGSPFFAEFEAFFKGIYFQTQWTSLSDLNHHLIQRIATDFLGAQTEFRDSREFDLPSDRQERLIEILTKLGATRYLSGPSARVYLDLENFEANNIEVVWMDYGGYPQYPQRHGHFEHGVSIIDLLFNTGSAAENYMKCSSAVLP